MGGQDDEMQNNEQPSHKVVLPDFYIGQFPVTQALWKGIMGENDNPSSFKGDNRPVEQVSWNETKYFLQKLAELTNRKYRLPSEAEWEYAARGGLLSQGYRYAGSDKLKSTGWYNANSHGETKPVGLKYPNELHLYDISGNVWEWVEDFWHDHYQGAPNDGSAWVTHPTTADRVIRGGSWDSSALPCRVSYRHKSAPDNRLDSIGFRLAFTIQVA